MPRPVMPNFAPEPQSVRPTTTDTEVDLGLAVPRHLRESCLRVFLATDPTIIHCMTRSSGTGLVCQTATRIRSGCAVVISSSLLVLLALDPWTKPFSETTSCLIGSSGPMILLTS